MAANPATRPVSTRPRFGASRAVALGRVAAGALAGALVAATAAPAAAESIVEANVLKLEAGDIVGVSRIPDGVYLRRANDPDDIIWERLPEYRVELTMAPPWHESVDLRYDEDAPSQYVYVNFARTADRFYVRLRWRDASRDAQTTLDRFRDGVAVQFAIGGDETSSVMGSDAEEPVNIWYWRADSDQIESLAAGGPGSTTHLDAQPVSGASLYQPGETSASNQWVVVMSSPLQSAGEHQVSFDRAQVPVAFALWQGGDGERDGLKRVSDDWILVDLAAE